jgi:hypothetical protein
MSTEKATTFSISSEEKTVGLTASQDVPITAEYERYTALHDQFQGEARKKFIRKRE